MNIGANTRYVFLYDATGPMTLRVYNGTAVTTYYYVRNLQGDIIAILNTAGKAVVEYTYDAWGNVLTITGEAKDTIGQQNPLLYRSYVYDRETKLYYLQSRYYDPEMGRFINADRYASTGQGLFGKNMFNYCGSNPVNCTDVSGTRYEYVEDLGGLPVTVPQIAQTAKEQTYGVINGQANLPYSNVPIGLGSYGASGCAYIATYNTMQLIGKPRSLASITAEMFEYGAVVFGAGGAGPWGTATYFDAHGVNYTGSFSGDDLVVDISEGSVITFTVMYSTGWHAMTALYTNGEYNVFNLHNYATDAVPYKSLSEVYSDGLWLYGFRVAP